MRLLWTCDFVLQCINFNLFNVSIEYIKYSLQCPMSCCCISPSECLEASWLVQNNGEKFVTLVLQSSMPMVNGAWSIYIWEKFKCCEQWYPQSIVCKCYLDSGVMCFLSLDGAISQFQTCCNGKIGSCNIRYATLSTNNTSS